MADLDRTATMTSDSTPSPNVTSASTTNGAGYEAFRAFDKNTTSTAWSANTSTGILKYNFGSAKWASDKYVVTGSNDTNANRSPKTWTFEGSNNDSTWTTLDTRSSETAWSMGETRTYTFSNAVVYQYYRMNISANNGDVLLLVEELAIFAPERNGFFLFM
jgi:hypothetical protein